MKSYAQCLTLCWVIWLLHLVPLSAQQYNFRPYSLAEGLPQSEVLDMIIDKRGYLWVATNGGGVARFNGKNFRAYTKKEGVGNDLARFLLADKQGNIWIANLGGICRYDGYTFAHVWQKKEEDDDAAKLMQDKAGIVWAFGTRRGQPYALQFDGKRFQEVTKRFEQNMSFGADVKSISQDREGNLYMSLAGKGLMLVKNYQFESPDWLKNTNWAGKSLDLKLHDSQNRYWLCATEKGKNMLYCLQNGNIRAVELEGLPANARINAIMEDSKHHIWITTEFGVYCVSLEYRVQRYHLGNGLPTNHINKATEDKEGNIWLSSLGFGLLKFERARFISVGEADGLKPSLVRAIFEDKAGKVWLGVDGGYLSYFDGKKAVQVIHDPLLNVVRSIDTTDTGKLLISGVGGLLEWDGKALRSVNAEWGLPEGFVTYFARIQSKDSAAYIVITQNRGVYVCKPQAGKAATYKLSEMKNDFAHAISIYTDSRQRTWICAHGAIYRYYKGKTTRYSKKEGLKSEIILQATEDKLGNIWLATYDEGVARFDGEHFQYFNTQNSSMPSNIIYSVITDTRGNVWAGTQKGVSKILLDGRGKVEAIYNYDDYDGFKGAECNGFANFRDNKGNLWFGTVKGAIRYNPNEDQPHKIAPSINITNVRLFFRAVDWHNKEYKAFHKGLSEWFSLPKNLVLPSDKSHISIDFEAISYYAAERVRYSWRLDGVDADWSPPSDKTEAVYPHLSGGSYVFRVRAMNSEGVWSAPVLYRFRVSPPWYLTWWAILAFASSAILVGYALVQWRIKALKAYQRHLEKLVAEKTSEVVEQNIILQEKTEEIIQQTNNLQLAHDEIKRRQEETTDSITYAKRIQDAILPPVQRIRELLPDSFVLFRPRDIVSGDFYWFAEIEPFRNQSITWQEPPDRQDLELLEEFTKSKGKVIIAAADCTGHGVPGAFMSMIGNELLHEIVREKNIISPEQILYFLHIRIRQALNQTQTANRDGMDISICLIDRDAQTLAFAGARSRILYFQGGELQEIKGDKMPIGGEQMEIERVFTLHTVPLAVRQAAVVGEAGEAELESLPTSFYLFSDGYIDQFGSKERKKFQIGRFRQLLQDNQDKDMPAQQAVLEASLDQWIREGGEPQTDDIMVLGVKL